MGVVEIVAEALTSEPPARAAFVQLYLRWPSGSVSKQTHVTPQIISKFADLAAVVHEETATVRQAIIGNWMSKPRAAKAKPAR